MNKSVAMLVLVLCSMLYACTGHSSSSDVEHATGDITTKALFTQYASFNQGYDDFQLTAQQQQQLATIKQPLVIDIYFGTWCHDSEREVPKMLKALSQFNNITINLIALDLQKQEPKGRAKQQNIRFTPTFIIRNGQQELGRIIERPKQDLVSDLLMIVQG